MSVHDSRPESPGAETHHALPANHVLPPSDFRAAVSAAASSAGNEELPPSVSPPQQPISNQPTTRSSATERERFLAFLKKSRNRFRSAASISAASAVGPPREDLSAVAIETDEDTATDLSWAFLRAAPAWLFSLVTHLTLLLVLGLWLFHVDRQRHLELEMIFAEKLGDQLIDDALDMPAGDETAEELIITPKLPEVVVNPLATPPKLEVDVAGSVAASELVSPTIGNALKGREQGMKQALLSTYGGTAVTEAAVKLGLEWLKRNQRPGGYWSMRGPYANGAPFENRVAATAMALLAFQGAGHTHERGGHQKVVERGKDYLLKQLDSFGNFYHDNDDHQRLYSQAQATIALCELYGMTRDEELRAPAQRAIDYAVRIQDKLGGWRYRPGQDSDTSVTGWFMMAFQSGMMAGLEVPSPVLERISEYLDKVASYDGSRYAYRPGRETTVTMTAEALLCRQYLGWQRDDPRLREGVDYIRAHPITYRDQNVYYWYYATQVLHHMEGDAWEEWNSHMRQVVPENQTKTGKERGSWSPTNDRWGGQYAGRLYTTCLSIYLLEVYYRHLPIYGHAR